MAFISSPFEIGTPMLDRSLPGALFGTENPVFEHDLRRERWFRDQRSLSRYGLVRLAGLYVLIILVGLALRGNAGENIFARSPYPSFYIFRFITYSAPIGTLASLIIDAYYVMVTVKMLSGKFESGEWELLKLTAMHEQDLLAAKYSIAQIRSWRAMTLDRALQTAFPLLTAIWLMSEYRYASYLLVISIPNLILGLWLPLSPMRAVTAVRLLAASRVHNTAFAILTGLGAILGLRISMVPISYFNKRVQPKPLLLTCFVVHRTW